ncbi:MAG: hypothetical protein ACREHV_10755 [Rhizomicrobium sp.]
MRPDSGKQPPDDIESIDREIHNLLLRRSELGETFRIGASVSPAPIRAAQAATVLRTVLSRHSGAFPLRALVRIWSDILFACDTQTTLHVFGGADTAGFHDLARTYFGCVAPVVLHSSASAVVHACADDPLAIGLVPPPESVENGQVWWEQLVPAGSHGPRIAQSLPFVRSDSCPEPLPQGFAIGAVEQEFTGADTTVLRLECHLEMSRARLQSILRQAGFEAQILAASRESAKSAASKLLVANKGFVAADDPRLSSIAAAAGDTIERVALVGGFADPFEAARAT